MTDTDLLALYRARQRALKGTKDSTSELRDMPAALREAIDAASRKFRTADKAIVRELILRDEPAKLPGVTLWLTADRLNFVTMSPDGSLSVDSGKRKLEKSNIRPGVSVLYRYPK